MTDKETDKEKESQDKKVGVYICHCGGNISDHVDVEAVAEKVKKLPGVAKVHTNTFMCSDPGQELIQKDIKEGSIDRVVVASCAPSLHELTFRGAIKRANFNPYLYEHANIREQVSWVHHGEKATEKAASLVAAAVAKTKQLTPLEPIRVDARRHATVIGGGIAGMRAAIDLAEKGLKVALIEKSPFLGGRTAKLDTLFPTGEKAADLVRAFADKIEASAAISVHTCAQIVEFQGYVGNFNLTVKQAPPVVEDEGAAKIITAAASAGPGDYVPFAGYFPEPVPTDARTTAVETGAVVFATGFHTYTPGDGEFGYLKHRQVMTLPELIEEMAKSEAEGKYLQIDGNTVRSVALIHCVGSRQIPGIHEPDADGNLNEYCSRTCCTATLQAAAEIKKHHPATQVFEFYRDIRTYGRGQEEIYEEASNRNVLFFRYEPEDPPVVERANHRSHPLQIRVKDTLTFGEEVIAPVDLVVLSVGMEAGNIKQLVEMMKLPVGADRFLQEVHPKLRPVELANTGILLAGTCQAPMDIGEACAAAQAAAAKAATLLDRGYAELDPFVASVDEGRCQGHGECREVCPVEGTIVLEAGGPDGEAKRARVNAALCTGCGICVAACPENAINVKGWTLQQYEAMVDAIVAA
ncbi:MAG: CoB--CoM heterodisulfide reductase iron-sulfur subunit A family protein [Deltaproteobacteria bacterium]|nr:CoB--CoM heterodisulfide reductase iron-sulfur subunit A family protein [Deltaproteobacteria bacterium]